MKILHILLVDDSTEWLNHHTSLFQQLLPDYQLNIETALSAAEGFAKAVDPQKQYDFIVTDLEMEQVFDFSYAGEWLLHNLVNRDGDFRSKLLVISGCYYIDQVAANFGVKYIHKSDLVHNPLLLKYKIDEMLEK